MVLVETLNILLSSSTVCTGSGTSLTATSAESLRSSINSRKSCFRSAEAMLCRLGVSGR